MPRSKKSPEKLCITLPIDEFNHHLSIMKSRDAVFKHMAPAEISKLNAQGYTVESWGAFLWPKDTTQIQVTARRKRSALRVFYVNSYRKCGTPNALHVMATDAQQALDLVIEYWIRNDYGTSAGKLDPWI